MRWQPEKTDGEPCGCCKKERLILVRGALVCRKCDAVNEWPGGR